MSRTSTVPVDTGRLDAGTDLPSLMYHAIPADEASITGPMDVTIEQLERQLSVLISDGWTLTSQVRAIDPAARRPGSRTIAVTFDDAYADVVAAAEMVLELGGNCSIYVPTSFIGSPGNKYAQWSELARLSELGVELGSHSDTHRALDVAPPAALRDELVKSKTMLESETGATVTGLAYPHGYTSRRVRRQAMLAGYRNACTVGRRVAKAGDPLLALPRLQPMAGMSMSEFVTMIERGEPGIMPRLKRGLTPAWRLARATALKLGKELT